VVEPLAEVHSRDVHVGYLLGRPDKDAPGGNEARRSRPSLSVHGATPFGTELDVEAAVRPAVAPPSPPPFRIEPRGSFAQQPADNLGARLASVSKMSVAEMRVALRARGLSPAGGGEVLQARLTESLQGQPGDVVFAPQESCSMERPSFPGPPPPSRRAATIGGASAGGGKDSMRSIVFGY